MTIHSTKPVVSVLIPDAESHFTLPVIACLASVPNVQIHLLSTDPWVRARRSRYRETFDVIPPESAPAERLDAVVRAVCRNAVDVVLPACETGARLVDRHAADLSRITRMPPNPREAVLETASDKWRLARFLAEHGLPHPPTLLVTRDPAFRRDLEQLTFPVLLKPRWGAGGHGIRAFSHRADLLAHIEQNPTTSREMIVQTEIPGRDIDCSALCRGGEILAWTTQRGTGPPPRNYAPATELEMVALPAALEMARRLVRALGYDGIANLDMRQDESGKVTVIEINARFWSSVIASHAAGVNFPHLLCLAAREESFAPPEQRAMRFLQARRGIEQAARAFLRNERATMPRFDETVWPYLLADPLPQLFGRFQPPRPDFRGLTTLVEASDRSARAA